MGIDWSKFPDSADHRDVHEKMMKTDPQYRKDWEEFLPRHNLISAIIGARIKKGWTQTDLAEAAGTSQSSIARLESGEHEPRWSTAVRVCEALDVPIHVGKTKMTG